MPGGTSRKSMISIPTACPRPKRNDFFPHATYVALLPTATWALIPLCGLDKKLSLVRVVLQLLKQTVGVKGEHRSRSLGLEGEVGRDYYDISLCFYPRPSSSFCFRVKLPTTTTVPQETSFNPARRYSTDARVSSKW